MLLRIVYVGSPGQCDLHREFRSDALPRIGEAVLLHGSDVLTISEFDPDGIKRNRGPGNSFAVVGVEHRFDGCSTPNVYISTHAPKVV